MPEDRQENRRNEEQRKQQQSRSGSGEQMSEKERESLEAREYRDKEGDVHHHTHTYMDQHGKRDPAGSSQSGREGGQSEKR